MQKILENEFDSFAVREIMKENKHSLYEPFDTPYNQKTKIQENESFYFFPLENMSNVSEWFVIFEFRFDISE